MLKNLLKTLDALLTKYTPTQLVSEPIIWIISKNSAELYAIIMFLKKEKKLNRDQVSSLLNKIMSEDEVLTNNLWIKIQKENLSYERSLEKDLEKIC